MATEVLWPGFNAHAAFAEQVRLLRPAEQVRAIVLAPKPADFDSSRPTRLILFATPNGNTAEQTLGSAMVEGRDWHFDIQHVAAQVRRLRALDSSHNVVLAVVQPDGRSWPAWRAERDGGSDLIVQIVEAMATLIPTDRVEIDLSCHSGGGSFVFGFLNADEHIPSQISRLVFLDANYSWSDQDGHGHKVQAWLDADTARRAIFIAYDDRNIMYNGKKVVGPTGGTFRATHRMLESLRLRASVEMDSLGLFERHITADQRWLSLIHPNPDNRILHTRLVGDMNGLLYGLTLGTPVETAWGALGEPRAYLDWIQPEPFDLPGDSAP